MSSDIGQLIQRAARLHRARIASVIGDLGLFPGQEQALLALAESGETTVGELAVALNVRPPTISKMVQRLVVQNMIDRRDGDVDARRTTLTLTKEGQRCAKALKIRMAELDAEMEEALEGKDFKRLRKLLKRLSRALTADRDVSLDEDASDQD